MRLSSGSPVPVLSSINSAAKERLRHFASPPSLDTFRAMCGLPAFALGFCPPPFATFLVCSLGAPSVTSGALADGAY